MKRSFHHRLPETPEEHALIAAYNHELGVLAAMMNAGPELLEHINPRDMDLRRVDTAREQALDIQRVKIASLGATIERVLPDADAGSELPDPPVAPVPPRPRSAPATVPATPE